MALTEEWRPVVGHPNYSVSSLGRVISRVRPTPRLLRGSSHPRGYRMVHLAGFGPRTVHSIVAEAFLGARPDGMEVCHNNGDPTDNRASNLRYGTHAENMQDKLRHGRDHNANKTECPDGHPYDAANTYIQPNGQRRCRTCHRAQRRAHKIRRAFRAAGIEVAA